MPVTGTVPDASDRRPVAAIPPFVQALPFTPIVKIYLASIGVDSLESMLWPNFPTEAEMLRVNGIGNMQARAVAMYVAGAVAMAEHLQERQPA